ncbi:MAG TPA: alpha/beta hydrolase [Solirubrobacteraceae bacterium]|nr:alpha/beta hydrolase [Solirubrobacteraceae bacterium]
MPRPFEQGRFEDLPERPRLAHRYSEGDTATVVVHSVAFGPIATHVVSYGPRDAPPLLLIHGLMTTSYSWRYMFEQLGDRYRLVVPDLPGCGRSTVPAADRPLSGVALGTFIGELQQTLGIGGCPAVGNSLGGLLCMHTALRDPATFDRLAVIHAPAVLDLRLAGLHVGLRLPLAKAIFERVVRRAPRRFAHKNVRYYDETLKSLEEAHEYGAPIASAAGARALIRYLDDALDPRELRTFERVLRRRRDSGAGFPVRLMLAYSREDPTVPPEHGPRLHALVPGAELHWIERSSHFPQVDRPAALAELLASFLEQA